MAIAEAQQGIVEEFSAIDGWEDRYRRIIDYGRDRAPMDEAVEPDTNRVQGRKSTAWPHASPDGGRVDCVGASHPQLVRRPHA